jgi:hypothetical protein
LSLPIMRIVPDKRIAWESSLLAFTFRTDFLK